MNSLQLNAILPQQTQNLNSVQAKTSEESSFAEILKTELKKNDGIDEKSAEKSSLENSEKSALVKKSEEKSDEKIAQKESSGENEISKKSENSKETEKTEEKSSENKTARKSEKSDEKIKSKNQKNDENLASQAVFAKNQIQEKSAQTSKNQKIDENENLNLKDAKKSEKIVKTDEKSLDLQKIKEISGKNQAEENSDDFKELVDAAVDFFAENKNGNENESAKNLAELDSKDFLAQTQSFAGVQTAQADEKNKIRFSDEKTEKADVLKSKKKSVSFDVHDLRTAKVKNSQNLTEKSAQKIAAKKDFEYSISQKNDSAAELTMELSGKASADITSSSSQAAGANGSVFQSMLSSSVQENAAEIVKAGNIILKDNNQGSINLILKPESLGNVKISLNLNDKIISGQINVQSREAFEAFRESLDSLKQAFLDSGFDTGNFDLNFSQQSFAQSGNNANGGNENSSAAYFAEKIYGGFVSNEDLKSSSADSVLDSSGKEYSVNIVA